MLGYGRPLVHPIGYERYRSLHDIPCALLVHNGVICRNVEALIAAEHVPVDTFQYDIVVDDELAFIATVQVNTLLCFLNYPSRCLEEHAVHTLVE